MKIWLLFTRNRPRVPVTYSFVVRKDVRTLPSASHWWGHHTGAHAPMAFTVSRVHLTHWNWTNLQEQAFNSVCAGKEAGHRYCSEGGSQSAEIHG